MAADAGDEVVDAEAGDAPPPRGRRRTWVVAVVVLVALAAGVGVGALWTSRADLQAEIDRRDDIAAVAGRFAEALLTYDHTDLEGARDAVTDLSTDRFAAEYVGAFDAGLGTQIESLEAMSSATVREVFVARSEGDTARAIVIADTEIVSAAGSRGTVGTYLDMTLVRLDGRWRVDDVTSVANAGSRLDPVPGSEADVADDDDADDAGGGAGGAEETTTTTTAPDDAAAEGEDPPAAP